MFYSHFYFSSGKLTELPNPKKNQRILNPPDLSPPHTVFIKCTFLNTTMSGGGLGGGTKWGTKPEVCKRRDLHLSQLQTWPQGQFPVEPTDPLKPQAFPWRPHVRSWVQRKSTQGRTPYHHSDPSTAMQPFHQLFHILLPNSILENSPKQGPTATNIPWAWVWRWVKWSHVNCHLLAWVALEPLIRAPSTVLGTQHSPRQQTHGWTESGWNIHSCWGHTPASPGPVPTRRASWGLESRPQVGVGGRSLDDWRFWAAEGRCQPST